MTREQITIELESVTARLRSLRHQARAPEVRTNHEGRLIDAQESMLIAEIEMLSAHRRVLDAQDLLSAIEGWGA